MADLPEQAAGDPSATIGGLPAEIAHLTWLLGTWVGVGTGDYPTIEPFRFGQQVQFTCDGRPFLTYLSRTWMVEEDGSQGRPLAVETGFWRPLPDNGVEVLLTHSTGILEMYLGAVEIGAIQDARITRAKAELRTDVVVRSDEAKPYQTGHRLYGLAEGDLLWTFDMAAMGEGMSNHIAARLSRADG